MADVPSQGAPQRGPRRRRPPRRTVVERIERVTPKLIRVTLAGEELENFGPPKPGAHMKLLFPPAGWNHKDEEAPRPPSRTYTPLRYDAADCKHIVLVADETALPAAGTVLESLPAGCGVTALCEVPDAAEERPLSSTAAAKPKWLHRSRVDLAGTLLEQEIAGLSAPADAYWWIACEAAAMRRIRTHLLKERKIGPSRVHTRGYWRLGETNYPDHDYGED